MHSATGVFPLAAYLIWHLAVYAHALSGCAALGRALGWLGRWSWLVPVEALVILAPLAVHAGYGIVLTVRRKKREPAKAVLRATGMAVLAFLVYHLAQVEAPLLLGRTGPDEICPLLVSRLSSTTASVPVHALVYLIGVLAATMHAFLGLHALCVSRGLVATPRARRIAAGLLGAVAFGTFAMGAGTVVFLATGDRSVIPERLVPGPTPCDLPAPLPPTKK